MAWQTEMTDYLRVLIGDMDEPPTFDDDKLAKVLLVSSRQVGLELNFSQRFVADIELTTISPDPTDTVGGTRDDSYVNLSCMKAASILDQGSAIIAASRAVAVKDGSSSVDLRSVFKAKLALIEKGWSAVYADAKLEYQAGQVRIAGAAVMTPFRLFAYGGYAQADGYLTGDPRQRATYFY